MRIGRKKVMRKPAPANPKRWQDKYNVLSYENTEIKVYNSGMITIKEGGTIQNAAIAFAKYVLEDNATTHAHLFKTDLYTCIDVTCEPNKKYTVKWIGKGVIENDLCPEPKFWGKFKKEFERYCKLKAFL